MSWDEFCDYIIGLGEDTPLVKMIRIRKETDADIIKKWPADLKRINAEWRFNANMKYLENKDKDVEAAEVASIEKFFRGLMSKDKD